MTVDRYDALSWLCCAAGVALYIVWWKHDIRTYPPKPAVISLYRG